MLNCNQGNEGRRHNIGFAKWQVQCFYDSLVQGSSSAFQMNICVENPPLRKAENRQTVQNLLKLFIQPGFNNLQTETK